MRLTYLVHIAAGTVSLLAGYVALYAPKGRRVHRRSGMAFVVAMLVMCIFGVLIAAARSVAPTINIPAGVLTAYLVVTSVTTVRPLPALARWLDPALMAIALGVGATCLVFGVQAVANGGNYEGMPAFPYFMFGVVGTLGALLDLRMMRAGGLTGVRRLTRHLWRMSFALFIAAMSFFLGQADELPAAIRKPPLLALPVLAVLATMLYWLWRVRVGARAPAPAREPALQLAVGEPGR